MFNIFRDGEWAILECRDSLRLRGCGFFHVVQRISNGAPIHVVNPEVLQSIWLRKG